MLFGEARDIEAVDIEAVETTAIVVGAEEDPSITLMATPAILMERRRIFLKGTL